MPSVAGRARSMVERHGRPVTIQTTIITRDPNSDWDEETRVDHETTMNAIVSSPGAASPRYNAVMTRTDADRVVFIRDDTAFPLKAHAEQRDASTFLIDGGEYRAQFLADDGNGLLRIEVGST